MPSVEQYHPFELPPGFLPPVPVNGHQIVHLGMGGVKPPKAPETQSARWLRNAMIACAVLALTAAAVSFTAQYLLVLSVKGIRVIAGLEAGIPDAGSAIFASLGIALALRGRRAIRARALNVACVGISLGMNALAADPGWRNLAIWIMPSAVYALASDTLIGVIRTYALAKQAELADADEATPLDIIGRLILWNLRLVMAPASTVKEFRRWVIECAPVAPGRVAVIEQPKAIPHKGRKAIDPPKDHKTRTPRTESKRARFLALVEQRYGPLASIDPAHVSKISAELAPEIGYNAGSARRELARALRAVSA